MVKKRKIICVIQARMNSKRLKGKVLLKLKDKSVLNHIIDRIKLCKDIDLIVVATTYKSEDLKIVNLCKKLSVNYYRGKVNDVLSRFYHIGKKYSTDAILRITADCPLIDPKIIDKISKGFLKNNFDSFGLLGNFPDGLDATIYNFSSIKKAHYNATKKSDREHVGTYIDNNPKKFKIGGLKLYNRKKYYRWTLDEKKDYIFIKEIYKNLYDNKIFYTNDVFKFIKENPQIEKINSKIFRNEGYLKSILHETKKNNKYI